MAPIKFTPGQCIVCEAEITFGLFCSKCLLPPPKAKTPETKRSATLRSINQMKFGEEGFVSLDAIFVVDDEIWLINSFLVSDKPIDDLTVEIFLDDDGIFLVAEESLDWDNMPEGWPKGIDHKWFSSLVIVDLDDDTDDDTDDYEVL